MIQVPSLRHNFNLSDIPKKCPNCKHAINPNLLFVHHNEKNGDIEVFATCPSEDCEKSFIAYYYFDWQNDTHYFTGRTSKGRSETKIFSENIEKISPKFILIFNQAFIAQQENLDQISGVGYRKALEFLIKDYSILLSPDKQDEIERTLLAKCIDNYVSDSRIKSVSKRAAWLGNDETHYIKKWETKDIEDLKRLIELTLHWIEMEQLTKSFEDEMPG